jgi:hypothetical protein
MLSFFCGMARPTATALQLIYINYNKPLRHDGCCLKRHFPASGLRVNAAECEPERGMALYRNPRPTTKTRTLAVGAPYQRREQSATFDACVSDARQHGFDFSHEYHITMAQAQEDPEAQGPTN